MACKSFASVELTFDPCFKVKQVFRLKMPYISHIIGDMALKSKS